MVLGNDFEPLHLLYVFIRSRSKWVVKHQKIERDRETRHITMSTTTITTTTTTMLS